MNYKVKLLSIGIPASIKGFHYLNRAFELYEVDTKMMWLYEKIAKEFNTTSSRVERAIRHALEKAHFLEDDSYTNSSFIANYKFVYWAPGTEKNWRKAE